MFGYIVGSVALIALMLYSLQALECWLNRKDNIEW